MQNEVEDLQRNTRSETTTLRRVFRVQDGEEVQVRMNQLKAYDVFRMDGDDLCPHGKMVAMSNPFVNKDGVWTIEAVSSNESLEAIEHGHGTSG